MIVFLSDIMHPAFRKAGPVSMFLTAVLAAAVACEPVRVEEQDNRIPAVQYARNGSSYLAGDHRREPSRSNHPALCSNRCGQEIRSVW